MMIRIKTVAAHIGIGGITLLLAGSIFAASEPVPPFQEIYNLLRTNLPGITEADLEKAAAQGLLKAFEGQVSIEGTDKGSSGTNATAKIHSASYEGAYGYVRLTELNDAAVTRFKQVYEGLSSSNRLKGLVLDLRSSRGSAFDSAAAIADLFFTSGQPLADWGDGLRKASDKKSHIQLPVAILVNASTGGAGEVLAAILRDGGVGLILGARTAGRANIAREFTLSTGQRVRVATTPVKVRGNETVPLTGLVPDIQVSVAPDDEQTWLADPYKVIVPPERLAAVAGTNDMLAASSNSISRRRINEAELVRMQREGFTPDFETNAARETVSARPTIQDPTLARAIDLLKGLAVVRQSRGS